MVTTISKVILVGKMRCAFNRFDLPQCSWGQGCSWDRNVVHMTVLVNSRWILKKSSWYNVIKYHIGKTGKKKKNQSHFITIKSGCIHVKWLKPPRLIPRYMIAIFPIQKGKIKKIKRMAEGIYLIFGVLFLIERLPGLFLHRYFSFTFCTILDEGITAQGKTVIQESLPLLTQCYSSGIIRYGVRFLRWYEKKFLSFPIIQCYKVIPLSLIQRSKAWNAISSYKFRTFVFYFLEFLLA